MTPHDYVLSLLADGERIASIGSSSLDARVPSCPEWELADLLAHVGWVHRMLGYLAALPDGSRANRIDSAELRQILASMRALERPQGDLVAWFRQGAQGLAELLGDAAPTKTIHTYLGSHQPWLLARRAATETAIHRWDAEGVSGTPTPLPPDLAADAIDEFLDVIVPPFFKFADFAGTGQVVRLESTEADNVWLIMVTGDTTEWARHSAVTTAADVSACGTLSDLYLSLWGRPTVERLGVEGDASLLARWFAACAF